MVDKKKPKEVKIIIDGKEFKAEQKTFKTGRKGFGLYVVLKIDGYPHRVSLNIMEL